MSKVGQSFEEVEGCATYKDSFAYKCLTLNQKMEALLKTLVEESTIRQSEHEFDLVGWSMTVFIVSGNVWLMYD